MKTVVGLAVSRGYAAGPVFIYHGDGEIPIPEYSVEFGREAEELNRLKRAIAETRRDLSNLVAALKERTNRQDVRIFECHQMILEDPMLNAETERYVAVDHVNAESAVKRTAAKARAQFDRMNDPYFRERVRDLDDVERRILKALTGFSRTPCLDLTSPAIIVADDMTPSETVQLPREYVLGFAMNGGSATSHVALLARAMGIPAVSALGDITEKVAAGAMVLLDGTNGAVTVNPDKATLDEFNALATRQREQAENALEGTKAGVLKDGGDVPLYANVHPGLPIAGLKVHGARGIGLYRSEYLWLNRELEPTEEEQFDAYRDAAKFAAALGSSVAIRVLDVGGDKLVKGISAKEANPFLGLRSIRFLLAHPETFRKQLRAIVRASAFGKIAIIYPLVTCLDELRSANAMLAEEREKLRAEGKAFDEDIPVGVMIETPAAVVIAPALAKEVDFFSIGTNDLVQYVMAADRGNEAVHYLYQPLHPAVVEMMHRTIRAAKDAGIKVSVCGESAADPLMGPIWAAFGADMLSMSAGYIPPVASILKRLTRADLDEYAEFILARDVTETNDERIAAARQWMLGKIPEFDKLVS